MVFVDCGAHAGTLDVVGAAIVSCRCGHSLLYEQLANIIRSYCVTRTTQQRGNGFARAGIKGGWPGQAIEQKWR